MKTTVSVRRTSAFYNPDAWSKRVVGSRVAKSISAVSTPALVSLFGSVLLPEFV
jgi:hypothetical protein